MSHDFQKVVSFEHLIQFCMKHSIVNHIWSFSLPRDIWPWVALKGQIKVIECSLGCVSYTNYYIRQRSCQAEKPLVLVRDNRFAWPGSPCGNLLSTTPRLLSRFPSIMTNNVMVGCILNGIKSNRHKYLTGFLLENTPWRQQIILRQRHKCINRNII